MGIVDLGANVLYVDLAYYVNLYTSSPSAYGFENATRPCARRWTPPTVSALAQAR